MAFHVRDPETDAAVRKLAALRGKGITETIREAVEAQLKREWDKLPAIERVRDLQAKYKNLPRTDPRTDKEIADDLSGGL
jgi:antitoxin VapB